MAQRSEKFAWKLFPGVRRRCWRCGKEPLVRDDVAVHRRKYPGGKDEFLCVECRDAEVQASVQERRRRLGLSD